MNALSTPQSLPVCTSTAQLLLSLKDSNCKELRFSREDQKFSQLISIQKATAPFNLEMQIAKDCQGI
jgi:hypothetical protein